MRTLKNLFQRTRNTPGRQRQLFLQFPRACGEIRYAAVFAILVGTSLGQAFATDLYFDDFSAESSSKRYKVEAKSPDNATNGRKVFQTSFIYTCRDTTTKQVLWTRAQPMGKPQQDGYRSPQEGSPLEIFVSDGGWTIIRTSWEDLIAVDSTGRDRCQIDLLEQGFTKEERSNYVHSTTAGPMWSGYSLWYFLDIGMEQLFVVRPWWGRRIILGMEAGKLIDETKDISKHALAYERNFVKTTLTNGLKDREKWEKEKKLDSLWPCLNASYLAGRLPVPEAAPLLEQLQEISYSGSSTSGGLGFGEKFEGEVNPHSYSTFTLRQVVQLSLRRLGKTPRPLPATQFDVEYKDYKKNHPYSRKPLSPQRAENADKVNAGMKAEQVLDLLGAPDFVEYDTWEYDIDAKNSFSLILKWDVRKLVDVQKKTPALWKKGFTRDEQIAR